MTQVVQAGTVNPQSLLAPGGIVNILPPSQTQINGVASNILGEVGTATWGKKNTAVICGNMNEYVRNFGLPVARKYDLGTGVYAASLNFANNFRCVRVTDGTDAAASKAILDTAPATGMTATAIYTGTLGNSVSVTIGAGSAQNTKRISVSLPNNLSAGRTPEIFDNIAGTGLALWQAMVDAINLGQSGIRGPSELIVATVGISTVAPANATYTLTGGLDGATTITAAVMVGSDTAPRTGMYALRGSQCSVAMLNDMDDTTSYSAQIAFAISEGIFMHIVGPAGQTLAQAKTAKDAAGIDNYDVKFLVGDWCYIFDTYSGLTRLISPQGFACGRRVNLLPSESALNKQILGVVGTQTTKSGGMYTNADIIFACDNGLDVIYNPSPGGNYFSLQTGQNTSSNQSIRMDDYTTLTNYIAYSIAYAIGLYMGLLQNPSVRASAKATLTTFFINLYNLGLIGDVNFPNQATKAFSILLDATNNPSNRVSQGYMQADIQVVNYSVIRNFIVNLQNGQPSLVSTVPVN